MCTGSAAEGEQEGTGSRRRIPKGAAITKALECMSCSFPVIKGELSDRDLRGMIVKLNRLPTDVSNVRRRAHGCREQTLDRVCCAVGVCPARFVRWQSGCI